MSYEKDCYFQSPVLLLHDFPRRDRNERRPRQIARPEVATVGVARRAPAFEREPSPSSRRRRTRFDPNLPISVCRLLPFLNSSILTPNSIAPIGATWTVNSTADSTASGTLRYAIANASAGDTIKFSSSLNGKTITLSGTQLEINKSLTIDASALSSKITINANQTSRCLYISGSNSDVKISGVKFTGGQILSGSGGGISISQATVNLAKCVISDNSASNEGGGIYNYQGTLDVSNCTISGNSGGGIRSNDVLTMTNSSVTGNTGSGISVNGTVTITSSNVSNNIGHGIYSNGATLTMTNSAISGNETSENGGGIYASGGSMNLTDCTISNNKAANGGGIYNYQGTHTLADCVITANQADVQTTSVGGGIYNNGTLKISYAKISDNYAAQYGGGLYNSGTLQTTNCLINGNATSILSSSYGYGGGIYNYSSDTIITVNCTVAGNKAYYGGGLYNGYQCVYTAYNTILAQNTSRTTGTADIGFNANTTAIQGCNNLSSYTSWKTSDSFVSENNVAYSSSKALFTDGDNGDYTLIVNSQAINKGDKLYAVDFANATLKYDLAGKTRIVNNIIDVGAYEYQGTSAQLAAPSLSATSKTSSSVTLQIGTVANASSYSLQCSTSSSFSSYTTTTYDSSGSKTISGLTAGTTYYFRAKALSSNSSYTNSNWSSVVSVTTSSTSTQLTTPAIKSATSASDSITLAWNAVANAQGYWIYYKTSAASAYTTVWAGNVTSYAISGLTAQTTYDVKMKAKGDGTNYTNSNESAVVSVTTSSTSTQLATPTIKSATSTSDSITLAWNAVANAQGYWIYYKTSAASAYTTVWAGNVTSYAISGLTAQTTYDVKMKAKGDGTNYTNSNESAVVSVTTRTTELPSTVVTTNLDVVDSSDGLISLREAIAYAGTNGLGTTITFKLTLAGQSILLAGSALTINKPLTINAASLGSATVSIDAGGKSSVFNISGGTEQTPVLLNNLVLSNGKTAWYGGLVYSQGVTIIRNVDFYNGFAYYGGAIANAGSLTLDYCDVASNTAAQGGGIYNRSTGVLVASQLYVSGNTTTNYGGFLYNNGTATITSSQLYGNTSNNCGGGVYVAAGTVTVDSSTFANNEAKNYAGTVYNAGTFEVSNSSFSGGSAIYGGAIANFKTLTTGACNFLSNTATKQGGAIYHSSSIAANINGGSILGNNANQGGGLYVNKGTVRLTAIEITDNSATHNGGAVYSKNQAVLTDCVVADNFAKYYGGGVYNEKILRVRGTTSVSDNSTGTGKSPNIHTKSGGQIIYDSELAESVFDEDNDWLIEL